MNLFWKRILGQMQSTAKLEAQFAVLDDEFRRFVSIENSKELAEYRTLYEKVQAADFKEKKRTLINRKYKDTQEYRDMRKFQKLDNNRDISLYYETLKKPILAEYLEFRKKPEYMLLGKRKEVRKSEELMRLKNFERSREYKNYMRFHNSFIIKEYEKLRERVSQPEFIAANAFWADSRRWEKTDEAMLERRFNELAANADIKFYENTDPKKFAKFFAYTKTFYDGFDWNSINASNWTSGFNYVSDKLVGNHSFANEKSANNNGDNVSVFGGELTIHTRRENKTALAWDKKKGFVNKPFEFTSDVIHGANGVTQKRGVFAAKIRFAGRGLTQAFWLAGEHILPHINVAVCDGKSVEVGTHWNTKYEKKYTSQRVKGLRFADWYIYSLEWTEKELIWRINNIEILRTTDGVPTEAMFPMFSAFVAANQPGGEGQMQVDWIEVWTAHE